jgi:hypothetical protein
VTAATLRAQAEWLAELDQEMFDIINWRARFFRRDRLRDEMVAETYLTSRAAWERGLLTVEPGQRA